MLLAPGVVQYLPPVLLLHAVAVILKVLGTALIRELDKLIVVKIITILAEVALAEIEQGFATLLEPAARCGLMIVNRRAVASATLFMGLIGFLASCVSDSPGFPSDNQS
ncbi:hypothetical protein CCR91_13915 [Thiorhodovibrio winogradskyi]|nr:hypothetical protein [Thiorhodovibrio winogradskyi]